MSVDYDPYSQEAMKDPHPLYAELRATGCPYYIEKRRAWALSLYDDLRKASTQNQWLDFTAGQTPSQLMLGDPVPHTFMTMNVPENRAWRSLLEPHYSVKGVERELPRLYDLIEQEFSALRGKPSFDFYHDYSNKVMCINAGYNLGLDRDAATYARELIDRMILNRVVGQEGASTEDSQLAAQELGGLLHQHVQNMRDDPNAGGPHGRLLRDAVIDGQSLNDTDLLNYLFSLLVVGSETTPMATAGTLYYLHQNPEQKRQILADPALADKAFRETCRLDQPTNMLARRAAMDFTLNGANIKAGDNLLFLYASANRDERKFVDPDQFDMHRANKADISFGVGAHFCLGAHLAQTAAHLMLTKFLKEIIDFQVVTDECERAFGEHLNGFIRLPVRPFWK